ncbi:MAG: YgaP family membrane protein [Bacteroidia bacterium]
MKKNMGSTDRIVRLAIAVVLAILYFMNTLTGTLGLILLIVAVVFALTSFVSFCPLYLPLGLSTKK